MLENVAPGVWSRQWVTVGGSEGMAVFWKTAAVSAFSFSSFTTAGPRRVMRCTLRPAGYGPADTIRVYSVHLKAGIPSTSTADSLTRRLECRDIRDTLNRTPSDVSFLLLGDSNFYSADEGGYIRLTESQLDNDGRLKDPLNMPGNWHINSAYKQHDTQCPCLNTCVPGFSGGGMDDRFDIIITSYNLQDAEGFDYVTGTTVPYGNDGLHFNQDINAGGFNNAVGITVANALNQASDHIPAMVTIQLPAIISASPSLDFGEVIMGAVGVTQTLSVANAATAPADELNYSLVAPSGFTAPGGGFVANVGAAANNHSIALVTTTSGVKAGNLTVQSSDADTPSSLVPVTGTVLRHADASFDASSVQTSRIVEFGAREAGTFADLDVDVFNRGFDSVQALLQLTGASITGGDGRFSIVGGFNPVSVGASAASFSIHFDDTGANLDEQYEATLTFDGEDEALPGATPTADLTATLRARVVSSVVGLEPPPARAYVLRLEPARPNPVERETRFAYELPVAQGVSLEIFDLSGRRVASLVSGDQPAGRHEVTWRASDGGGGRVPGGLYFARFSTRGLKRVERVVVVL